MYFISITIRGPNVLFISQIVGAEILQVIIEHGLYTASNSYKYTYEIFSDLMVEDVSRKQVGKTTVTVMTDIRPECLITPVQSNRRHGMSGRDLETSFRQVSTNHRSVFVFLKI